MFEEYKKIVRLSFGNAANTYDSVSCIQDAASSDLVDFLSEFVTDSKPISFIDIGSGTGGTSLEMHNKFLIKQCVLCDISTDMLQTANQKISDALLLCCDAEQYDFQGYYDVGISNFCMQWFISLGDFIEKITKHCGIFAFTTLTNSSFRDYQKLFPDIPASSYHSDNEISQLCMSHATLIKSQFKQYNMHFPNIIAAAKYLKQLGAGISFHDSYVKHYKQLRSYHDPVTLNYDVFFGLVTAKSEQ